MSREDLAPLVDGLESGAESGFYAAAVRYLAATPSTHPGPRHQHVVRALQRVAEAQVTDQSLQVRAALHSYVDGVGAHQATADLADVATAALRRLDKGPKQAADRKTQAQFYFTTLAPAVQEVLLSASPAFAFTHAMAQKVGAIPQLTGLHLFGASPTRRQELWQAAQTCNLPVTALEARLAIPVASLDLERFAPPLAAYFDMAAKLQKALHAANISVAHFTNTVALSRQDKQAKLEGPGKQALFARLAEKPEDFLFVPYRNFVRGSSRTHISWSEAAGAEANLFCTLHVLSDADAALFAADDLPAPVRSFALALPRGLKAMWNDESAFANWITDVASAPETAAEMAA